MSDQRKVKLNALLEEYSGLPEYSGMQVSGIDTKSLFNDLPINIAATRGILDEISILLSCGADPNVKGEHGYTPLHNAVEQGHIDVVKMLIKKGADKNIKNEDDDTPFDLAKLLKECDIQKFLVGK